MNLTLIDILAILGALAWTPPIFSLIKNYLTKPKITIITPRNVSVGFTSLGSIFNLHLAFSVDHKSIVISGLRIRLIHENGEEKIFEWQGIQQQVMKMRTPDGSVMPYEKEASVLAMKLNEKEIEERFIQFQETAFQNAKYILENNVLKTIIYQKSQENYKAEEFLKSQEMQNLFSFTKQAFSWKSGRYSVTIEIDSSEEFKIIDNKYNFSLTPVDIEELMKNKDCIEHEYKNQLVPQSETEFRPVNWNWRNPTLHKN